MDMITWLEEGADGKPSAMTCTMEEAVRRQRAAGARRNYSYESDKDALSDFIAVHWATVIRERASMNDTIAGRMVRSRGFRWLPGMLAIRESGPSRRVTVVSDGFARCLMECFQTDDKTVLPVLEDAATIGCLMSLYDRGREMYRVPDPVYTMLAAYGMFSEKFHEELAKQLEER